MEEGSRLEEGRKGNKGRGRMLEGKRWGDAERGRRVGKGVKEKGEDG